MQKPDILQGIPSIFQYITLFQLLVTLRRGQLANSAPFDHSLPPPLAGARLAATLQLSRIAKAKEFAQRALRGLAGFAKALKVKYQDIEVGFDLDPEPGLADNGDLEHDLGASIHGAPPKPRRSRSATSSLPQGPPLPPWMKASSAFVSTA
jgi:hypothetical protein